MWIKLIIMNVNKTDMIIVIDDKHVTITITDKDAGLDNVLLMCNMYLALDHSCSVTRFMGSSF